MLQALQQGDAFIVKQGFILIKLIKQKGHQIAVALGA